VRDKGYTSLANPCAGIKGNKETGRDTYAEGQIWILQGKTKAKRRIEVTGELKF
jgi:hypothetical protein